MIKSLFLDIKKKLSDSSGYILLNVILVFLVLLVLIVSVTMTAVSNQRQAVKSKGHNSAYYYAEGGINEFLDRALQDVPQFVTDPSVDYKSLRGEALTDYLTEKVLDVYDFENNTKIMNQTVVRDIKLVPVEDDDTSFQIFSTVTIGNETRTLTQKVSNFNFSDGDEGQALGMCVVNAMTANSKFEFLGKSEIHGKVKLLTPSVGAVNWLAELQIVGEPNEEGEYQNGLYFARTNLSINDVITGSPSVTGKIFNSINKGDKPIDLLNMYNDKSTKEEMPDSVMDELPFFSDRTDVNESHVVMGEPAPGGWSPKIGTVSSLDIYPNTTLDFSKGNKTIFNAKEFKVNQFEDFNLYINVGNKDVVLVVDQLNLKGVYITVLGTGSLKIKVEKSEGNSFNPYAFYHEDAIQVLEKYNMGLNDHFPLGSKKLEEHDRVVVDSKNKISVYFYNDTNVKKKLSINENKHNWSNTLDHFKQENRTIVALNIITENYDVDLSAVSVKNISGNLYRTAHYNILAYGDDVTVKFHSSLPPSDSQLMSDIYYVPKGNIVFEATHFSGAMIADKITVGNTNAKLYFNVDVHGILPTDFSIFDPSCSGDSPGVPGAGEGTGGYTLGPIREVV